MKKIMPKAKKCSKINSRKDERAEDSAEHFRGRAGKDFKRKGHLYCFRTGDRAL